LGIGQDSSLYHPPEADKSPGATGQTQTDTDKDRFLALKDE